MHKVAGLGVHVDYLLYDNRPRAWLGELFRHLQRELALEAAVSGAPATGGGISDNGCSPPATQR